MAEIDKPDKFVCCEEKIADNYSINCDGKCKLQFHITCASIKKSELNSICANKSIKGFCGKCNLNNDVITSDSSEKLVILKSCFALITAQNKVIENLSFEIININKHVKSIDDTFVIFKLTK